MTAAQSLKIYDVLGKHFHNAEDARVVVTEIEQIIETKIADKSIYWPQKKILVHFVKTS